MDSVTSCLLVLALMAPQTLEPTDDIWVYPHAVDQTDDLYLRAWGDGYDSVGDVEMGGFSFSLIQFDLSELSIEGKKLKSAALRLMHDADAGFTRGESRDAPLEVRLAEPGFDEKRWSFASAASYTPESGKKAIVGQQSARPSDDGEPFAIEINLLKGEVDFGAALAKAASGKSKVIALALTSSIAPEGADGALYKFFSRSAEEKLRPQLILEFDE